MNNVKPLELFDALQRTIYGVGNHPQQYGKSPQEIVACILFLERFVTPFLVSEAGQPPSYHTISLATFLAGAGEPLKSLEGDSIDFTIFSTEYRRFLEWRESSAQEIRLGFLETNVLDSE